MLFLTRTLGPESYGLLAFALSILSFSRILSQSGIPLSGAKYIAQFRENDPKHAIAAVIESGLLVLVASLIVAISLLIGADFLSELLGESGLAPLLFVGSGYVLFYTLNRYNRAMLQGYEEITSTAKLHAIEGIVTVVLVASSVLFRPTPTSAMIGYVLAFAITTLIGFWLVCRSSGLNRSSATMSRDLRTDILRYNIPLSVTRLSNEVDGHLDVILVGYLANPTQVAFYSVGKQISQLTRVPAASLGFALSPTYGAETASGQKDSAISIYEESLTKILILYVPACVGIFVVADPAITMIFGDGYAGGVVVIQILSLFVFFEALERISGSALDYLGRARSRAVAKAITSTANLGLNILLIPQFGAAGAAVATVITYGAYTFLTVYVIYTELPFDYRVVGTCFAKVTLISVGMAGVVSILLAVLSGFLALMSSIAVGVGVWLIGCHSFDLLDIERIAGQLLG